MSGLYNAFFGVNKHAPFILGFLGIAAKDFGRFRDAFAANGEIVIYTRCGGGNRADYADVFERMRKHPDFLRDEDDKFDPTYCTFYFRIPEGKHYLFDSIDIGPWEPEKRWKSAIEKFESDPAEADRVANEAGKYIHVLDADGEIVSMVDILKKLGAKKRRD